MHRRSTNYRAAGYSRNSFATAGVEFTLEIGWRRIRPAQHLRSAPDPKPCRKSCARTHGSGNVPFGRSLFAIHSMLLGSLPSVSMNSFTALHAIAYGMNRPTGNGVSWMLRTHSRKRLKSPLELYRFLKPPPHFE